ncbi:hypothetical protein [Mycolicibacterium sp. NCC-Tsukiji]|uniref:hypothetical protein n=1 Tax=Mycolicibacterium sp. NCC-Tsukiji TaxID=2185272 RepID=UPI000EE683D9|nr:hypothetical protein [Mycolicibacterium sp. NCC-Tsukiji]GCA98684.1 hypothetical protein NCCNTM_23190 [Mycolicibacterium sp. NCC-Tsukiji]
MGTQSGLSLRKSGRYRLAVLAAAMGIAAATSQNVAWAETGTTDSPGTSTSQSGPQKPGPAKPKPANTDKKDKKPGKKAGKAQTDADTSDKSDAKPDASATDPKSGADPEAKPDPKPAAKPDPKPDAKPSKKSSDSVKPAGDPKKAPKLQPATASAPAKDATVSSPVAAAPTPVADATAPAPAKTPAPITRLAALSAANNTVGTLTTPTPPQPLNPIAKIIQLPGRIINTVLQVLDLTVSQSGPKSPFNWSPISEALFAGFRRIEDMLGLSKTPTAAPVVPELTYTGPTSGDTPTVEQFLNASANAYVLGAQPGDLKPFTVNGFQMQTFNPLSGAVGKAWVTPEGQIIVAYQGTTGGTNLLFHPLIALSQIFTDMQVIFTHTTPQAFWDSLAFERKVEAAALEQGYTTDDIFVTGHSLGGWEAQFVAQKTGRGGIGFEGPGLNTSVPGNGVNSNFVNIETYGDTAAYFSTDLPGLQPFMPAYDPTGGSKPHYGNIVMIGEPDAVNPLFNASALWGPNPINDIIFAVDILGNFFEHHLPGMQAYNLGVAPDPGVVPWLGSYTGPINDWGDLDIYELQHAASDAGVLIAP